VSTPEPSAPPTPISSAQAEALAAGTLPPVEQVRDGVWTIPIPFGGGIPDFTLSYAIEAADGSLALVDPGWGTGPSLDVLRDGLAVFGRGLDDVGLVAVTHLHVDHLGAAAAIREVSGATVAFHENEVRAIETQAEDRVADAADIASWGVPEPLRTGLDRAWGGGRSLPTVLPDLRVADGDVLPIPGREVRAVWTPGHTTGHLCFVAEPDGLLFTGDHVLPRINSGLGLGGRSATNPLGDYLASLGRLDLYADLEVLPGHEYRFRDVVARARVLASHREERSAHIASALDSFAASGHAPTMFEVASRVPFRGGIESMSGYLLASALAQTAFHIGLLGRSGEVRPA
jgi:glyoxylase-like metal-dependent hydrolase (beta-lactamase superfamily II)